MKMIAFSEADFGWSDDHDDMEEFDEGEPHLHFTQ